MLEPANNLGAETLGGYTIEIHPIIKNGRIVESSYEILAEYNELLIKSEDCTDKRFIILPNILNESDRYREIILIKRDNQVILGGVVTANKVEGLDGYLIHISNIYRSLEFIQNSQSTLNITNFLSYLVKRSHLLTSEFTPINNFVIELNNFTISPISLKILINSHSEFIQFEHIENIAALSSFQQELLTPKVRITIHTKTQAIIEEFDYLKIEGSIPIMSKRFIKYSPTSNSQLNLNAFIETLKKDNKIGYRTKTLKDIQTFEIWPINFITTHTATTLTSYFSNYTPTVINDKHFIYLFMK